jgi:predicted kinase
MDLRARGLNDLANVAMNHYWDIAAQPEQALALLPLFMALRAAVRMAVAVEAGDLLLSDRYRALGMQLLEPMSSTLLVAIGGLSGTGKSTLAAVVAPALEGPCGGRLLRTDAIRKAMAGVATDTPLTDAAYQPDARATIYRALAERARAALGARACVVADATFREDSARAAIEGAACVDNFLGFWLTAPTRIRVARVVGRHGDASDATPKIAQAQIESKQLGFAWRPLDANRPIAVLADEVRSHIAGRAARPAPPKTPTT